MSPGIDVERPSPARMYDYILGGAHNFAVDRQAAEQFLAAHPDGRQIAQVNRAFLRRAVEFLVDQGIRQFLDIGSGVPTVGHVHEIAQAKAPESRVVFVDIDRVAVEHSRMILEGNDLTAAVRADVRQPDQILAAPEVERLLDFSHPVAVLVVALFHFVSDADDPGRIVARLTEPLVPGSYLALSHVTQDGTEDWGESRQGAGRSGIDITPRTRQQVEALFAGHDLVEPGVVWVPSWRPESTLDVFVDHPERSCLYAGVGRQR